MNKLFQIESPFEPAGDQPAAIAALVDGLESGLAHQMLLGGHGIGKNIHDCAYDPGDAAPSVDYGTQ